MCGIAGWYNRRGRPVDERILQRMSDTLAHRGPDGAGIWVDGSIGLVHRRLAIRDLSPNGHQPMLDRSGRVIVTYNGEIYNERHLREVLQRDFGFSFRTRCDTELLPYAYLAWGEYMFERLEGMYAVALWDRARKCLLLARDGIGIKPLYFSETPDAIVFGSEIKALIAQGGVKPTLSSDGLHTYFAAGHAGPASSVIAGVEQVSPGSVITFAADSRAARTYWAPVRRPDIHDVQTALCELSGTLDDVIDGQLISDVPLGILQSGGIDSTVVSLSVARHRVTAPLFTASFEEESHNETALAQRVAAITGLPHRIVSADEAERIEVAFRAVVHHFDGQCSDTGALAYYTLSNAVREHSTVVLSGDGGDEFFCGYSTYAATRLAWRLRHVIPRSLARAVGRIAYNVNPKDERRLPATALLSRFALGLAEGGGTRAHLEWRRLVPEFLTTQIYNEGMACGALTNPFAEYARYYDESPGDVLDRAMLADQQFHLQSVLTKVDAMSMAHGLEVRVPLLDRRVMDLAGRMAITLLHPSARQPKRLLRLLAERLGAPREITRARKQGFNVPISQLLRGPLRGLADRVLDDGADVLSPFLRADSIRALWRAHRDRKADHAFALWPILTLATWRAGLARPERTYTTQSTIRGMSTMMAPEIR